MNEILDELNNNVKWLERYVKSDNIVEKGKVLDKISILCLNLSTMVTDAYTLMNDLEDDYKIAVSKYVKDSEASAAKAEREAEALYADKKKDWTAAKNGFKKLNVFLERLDKIQESHRQSISVIKQTGLKHMTGT